MDVIFKDETTKDEITTSFPSITEDVMKELEIKYQIMKQAESVQNLKQKLSRTQSKPQLSKKNSSSKKFCKLKRASVVRPGSQVFEEEMPIRKSEPEIIEEKVEVPPANPIAPLVKPLEKMPSDYEILEIANQLGVDSSYPQILFNLFVLHQDACRADLKSWKFRVFKNQAFWTQGNKTTDKYPYYDTVKSQIDQMILDAQSVPTVKKKKSKNIFDILRFDRKSSKEVVTPFKKLESFDNYTSPTYIQTLSQRENLTLSPEEMTGSIRIQDPKYDPPFSEQDVMKLLNSERRTVSDIFLMNSMCSPTSEAQSDKSLAKYNIRDFKEALGIQVTDQQAFEILFQCPFKFPKFIPPENRKNSSEKSIKEPIRRSTSKFIGNKRKKYSQTKINSADQYLQLKNPLTTRNKDIDKIDAYLGSDSSRSKAKMLASIVISQSVSSSQSISSSTANQLKTVSDVSNLSYEKDSPVEMKRNRFSEVQNRRITTTNDPEIYVFPSTTRKNLDTITPVNRIDNSNLRDIQMQYDIQKFGLKADWNVKSPLKADMHRSNTSIKPLNHEGEQLGSRNNGVLSFLPIKEPKVHMNRPRMGSDASYKTSFAKMSGKKPKGVAIRRPKNENLPKHVPLTLKQAKIMSYMVKHKLNRAKLVYILQNIAPTPDRVKLLDSIQTPRAILRSNTKNSKRSDLNSANEKEKALSSIGDDLDLSAEFKDILKEYTSLRRRAMQRKTTSNQLNVFKNQLEAGTPRKSKRVQKKLSTQFSNFLLGGFKIN